MRTFSSLMNGFALVFLIIGFALVVTSFGSAFDRIEVEPEDVFTRIALTIAILASLAVSAANVIETRSLKFRRAVFAGNIAILLIITSVLVGTVLIQDQDWPIWLVWAVPYAVHLLYRLLAPAPGSTSP